MNVTMTRRQFLVYGVIALLVAWLPHAVTRRIMRLLMVWVKEPTPVHINMELTKISTAWMQESQDYIAHTSTYKLTSRVNVKDFVAGTVKELYYTYNV